MLKRDHGLVAAALAAGVAAALPAGGQTYTDSEMTARFAAQKAAIQTTLTNPALGATRGLVLTNIEPDVEAVPGVTVQAPAPPLATAPTGTLTLTDTQPTTTEAKAAGLAAPGGADSLPLEAYLPLPKSDQVNIPITFAFDSAALSESQKPLLRQVCGALDAAGVGVMRIIGHTDASGPAGYNQKLSVLRAEEVERFFVNECHIAPDRLQAVGVGEQFPYDERDPLSGANRRVEFQAIS